MTFDELLKHLLERGVRYIVIGGVACALNVLNGKSYYDFIGFTQKNKDGITFLNEEALIEMKKCMLMEKNAIDVAALTRILQEKKG